MPANRSPIFSSAGDVQLGSGVLGPNANTAQDGTGANITSIWQADATNGGFIERIVLNAVGSPAASVARVFICTVAGAFTPGTSNTASNTSLFAEVSLPAVTVSQTAQSFPAVVPMDIALPLGYRVLLAFGTSTGAAGTGYVSVAVGGKY